LVFVSHSIARQRRWQRLLLRSQNKPGAPDIVDQLGFPSAVDLVPQSAHVHIDQIGRGRDELVVPDLFEQHCTGQQLITSPHHVFEEAEFAWQQIDLSLAAPRSTRDQIEFKRTDP
jgi:hypothetical protein